MAFNGECLRKEYLFLQLSTSPHWIGWSKSLTFFAGSSLGSETANSPTEIRTTDRQTTAPPGILICLSRNLPPSKLLNYNLQFFKTLIQSIKSWGNLIFTVILLLANFSKNLNLGESAKVSTGHPYRIAHQIMHKQLFSLIAWMSLSEN